jgi:hypothetical protein
MNDRKVLLDLRFDQHFDLFTYLCNKNQLYVLLILSLFRQSTSTSFELTCSPSSGGILYTYSNWYVLCCSVDCLLTERSPANRQSTALHNTYQLLYIYSIPPDDGLQVRSKHVEVDWRNKLSINSSSSWCLVHRCIEMQVQQNIKFIYLSPLTLFDSRVKSAHRKDTYSCGCIKISCCNNY